MVISRENVIMCWLVRAIDGYRAMVEWWSPRGKEFYSSARPVNGLYGYNAKTNLGPYVRVVLNLHSRHDSIRISLIHTLDRSLKHYVSFCAQRTVWPHADTHMATGLSGLPHCHGLWEQHNNSFVEVSTIRSYLKAIKHTDFSLSNIK